MKKHPSSKRLLLLVLAMLFVLLMATGCIPGDGKADAGNPAGFFWGIWHGWVAPISLIISLFKHNIRLYEAFNTGWWYDLGFYLAIVGGFGGLSFARKKSSHRRKDDD